MRVNVKYVRITKPLHDRSTVVEHVRSIRDLGAVTNSMYKRSKVNDSSFLSEKYNDMRATVQQLRANLRREAPLAVGLVRIDRGTTVEASVRVRKDADPKRVRSDLRDEYRSKMVNMRHTRKRAFKRVTMRGVDVNVNKDKSVYMEAGSFLKAYKAKISSRVFNSKKPMSAARHVGVEIEFIIPNGMDMNDLALEFAEVGLQDKVSLKEDGSIKCDDNDSAMEVAVMDTEDKIQDTITKVCSILNGHDAIVNESCGLHVHLDSRHRSVELVFRRLVKAQSHLFQLVPGSRRKNEYAERTPDVAMDKISGRYYAVNPEAFRKFNTIEVRLHSGTTQASKINNWIELLISVVNKGVVRGAKKTIAQWLAALGVSKKLRAFYIERAKKFQSSYVPEPEHSELPEDSDDCNSMGECDSCGEHICDTHDICHNCN